MFWNCYQFRGVYQSAIAIVKGSPLAPKLIGTVLFEEVEEGVNVSVDISGLPEFKPAEDGKAQIGPHGFHIHENGCCEVGDVQNPFVCSGGHYNPNSMPHGNHAGDFPVLFSNDGRSKMVFFTNKFKVDDIIGKSVVIYESPDDYKTSLEGGSGKRIGCGIIKLNR